MNFSNLKFKTFELFIVNIIISVNYIPGLMRLLQIAFLEILDTLFTAEP